jgi:hypothetical protein
MSLMISTKPNGRGVGGALGVVSPGTQLHHSCAQALSVPPWEFRQRLVWVRVLAVLHPSGIGSLGQHAITFGNQKELNLTSRILDPAGGDAGAFR